MLALMQGTTPPHEVTASNVPPRETPSGNFDAIFARQIRDLREAADLTQQQLADAMARTGNKIHRSTIGKIENGDRPVTVGEAAEIAGILGVDLADLLTEPEPVTDEMLMARAALQGARDHEARLAEQVASSAAALSAGEARLEAAQLALEVARENLRRLEARQSALYSGKDDK